MTEENKNTKIDKILDDTSFVAPSENARKRAINMAISEFESYNEEKKQKNSQGIISSIRHMGTTLFNEWRDPMNKKFLYGGMATAMVVILAGGTAFYQTINHDLVTHVSQDGTTLVPHESPPTSSMQVAEAEIEPDPFQAFQEEMGVLDGSKAEILAQNQKPSPQNNTVTTQESGDDLTRWRKIQEPSSREKSLAQADSFASPLAGAPQATMMARSSDMIAPPVMPVEPYDPYYQEQGNDQFEEHEISPVKIVKQEPVSTFSVDVDTASYSFVRRQLKNGIKPNPDAVRVEELINYFPYAYEGPNNKEAPFKANVNIIDSPWKEGNKLIHVGIKGYDIEKDVQPSANLVFLLDVSGSMNQPDKLPLLKNSFKLLLSTLKPDDTVSIVTYAGRTGTALEPTKVSEKEKILSALESLNAGGGTAGAAGIQGAYALAEENFIEDGVNRILLATDGDFNIGMSSTDEMKKLIEEKRESGIFLSVLGFGQGNLNDRLMQTLAQNGNGIAAHIDTLNEAQKVLVDEATSSLFPIAKDVKIQVEFNPATVQEYRLIGYETRALKREDFNNDKVDAGDIGAGHTVTAIYEITPVGSGNALNDPSRYDTTDEQTEAQTDFGDEYAFLKMRYKLPDEDTSKLITTPISTKDQSDATENQLFSIAVAGFGQLLKNDKYVGDFSYDDVLEMAQKGKGEDIFGYRAEFINLVRLTKSVSE